MGDSFASASPAQEPRSVTTWGPTFGHTKMDKGLEDPGRVGKFSEVWTHKNEDPGSFLLPTSRFFVEKSPFRRWYAPTWLGEHPKKDYSPSPGMGFWPRVVTIHESLAPTTAENNRVWYCTKEMSNKGVCFPSEQADIPVSEWRIITACHCQRRSIRGSRTGKLDAVQNPTDSKGMINQ